MKILALLVAVSAACAATTTWAQGGRFALGPQVGTPGAGVQAQFAVNDLLVLRAGYDVLKWDGDDTYHDIAYTGEIDFRSPGAFVDLHPFRNAFFVSGGAYFGERGVDLRASPDQDVTLGGRTFTPAQAGELTGRITLEETAPFVGLGYDDTFAHAGRWGFRLLAGAVFGDAPRVSLKSTGGTLSDYSRFQERVAQEEQEIQREADRYEILPVVQAGLNYRF